MSDFGIICEVNPLHGGHQYLLDEARRRGAERIVCVMSGNSVQRGELAVADGYTRAEALVACGADLVLELPYPWCSASAEFFARGGISVLRGLVDRVIFGSECGDIACLQGAADLAATPEFRRAYKERLASGKQAAASYYELLRRGGAGELSSNDLLGIEYIRAAKTLTVPLGFETVRRQGEAYDSENVEAAYPSALAIRQRWKEGDFSRMEEYLPTASAEVFHRAQSEGRLTDGRELDRAILLFFRLCEPESLTHIAGAEGGLVYRLREAARESVTVAEMMERVRTKRYTDASLRRLALYCMTGVTREDLQALPAYTTLLAASERGRELLAQKRRQEGGIPIVTKPSDAPTEARQFVLSEKLNAIFTLASPQKQSAGSMMKKAPFLKIR